MSHGRKMPNYGSSLSLLCHFTRASKNVLWVGRRKMKEKVSQPQKVVQPQTIFTWNDIFELRVVSDGNFKCNSWLEMVGSEVRHTLLKHLKKFILCLYEKLTIITYPRQYKLLNEWSQLFCKYHYGNKYLLKNFKISGKG